MASSYRDNQYWYVILLTRYRWVGSISFVYCGDARSFTRNSWSNGPGKWNLPLAFHFSNVHMMSLWFLACSRWFCSAPSTRNTWTTTIDYRRNIITRTIDCSVGNPHIHIWIYTRRSNVLRISHDIQTLGTKLWWTSADHSTLAKGTATWSWTSYSSHHFTVSLMYSHTFAHILCKTKLYCIHEWITYHLFVTSLPLFISTLHEAVVDPTL
jgi:hypothetical protein